MYPEQYSYMLHLKHALDAKGSALLEMPTGTGKTVCLIALITSYQHAHPETGKLVYCTRTVPEMVKCIDEIKKVIDFRQSVIGRDSANVLALCLSSRRNMCIHPRASSEGDRDAVDSLCRNMTSSWVRQKAQAAPSALGGDGSAPVELCDFYEGMEREGGGAPDLPSGVYDLEDLRALGKQRGLCPYFLARRVLNHANIVVYNYQYMLDPKVSNLVSRELEAESIVVFDEAHNIDNVCIEALSVTLDQRMMASASRSVNRLQSRVTEMKASDSQRLAREYQALVAGLTEQGVLGGQLGGSSNGSSSEGGGFLLEDSNTMGNPLLPDDIMQEAVPGNIRKAEHFVTFLKKVVEFFKKRLQGSSVEKEFPEGFMHDIYVKTALEKKALKFTYSRLNSLLRTLEITALEEFTPLQEVANFATLVSTYTTGFSVITEPLGSVIAGVQEPLLQLCCLDASLAIQPVFKRFSSVVITSGTLSPIELYPKLLNFYPVVRASLPMSTFRPCLLPLVVTRGSDQIPLSTKFDQRKDPSVVRNYGDLLLQVVKSTPDGVCCFFTSYSFMEDIISQWDQLRILQKVMDHKLVFLETKDVVETTLALDNFKRACDCGRGAVFFSVARGKVAEGIDFDRHYGRAVIVFGIPFQYTLSHVLRSRLDFLRAQHQIRDNDFLTFDALRQAAQCVGRVIRSKTDYGVVILADSRFNRYDKRSKFPSWIQQFLGDHCLNLSTEIAIEQIKTFLKQMGQPIDRESLHTILMNEKQLSAKSGAKSIATVPRSAASTRDISSVTDEGGPMDVT